MNWNNLQKGIMAATVVWAFAACNPEIKEADAFGTIEATEVVVSAETGGRILRMNVAEGDEIEAGQPLVLVDTMLQHLQEKELLASMNSIRTRQATVESQDGVFEQQLANMRINIDRIGKMLNDEAATQKDWDDLTGQAAVVRKQQAANRSQARSIASELAVAQAKRASLREQINRCLIKSPRQGRVIEKYAEAGEITAPGKPLAKVANLTVVTIKVYVSGGMIGALKIGQSCTVRVDDGDKGYHSLPGRITQVSDKAEFTPKIIQTKEDRVSFVYAVTIEVKNDGRLKAGMPGEVLFQ